ncbi:MAG: hypothetical protein EA343_03175 [Nodularia sp. (in: Bacteria)]|nr:MAG: hypothetical protein EA343_03175 [Nodularia sp. (in: cyanobacteria)]
MITRFWQLESEAGEKRQGRRGRGAGCRVQGRRRKRGRGSLKMSNQINCEVLSLSLSQNEIKTIQNSFLKIILVKINNGNDSCRN